MSADAVAVEPRSASNLSVARLEKRYKARTVVHDVSLNVASSEVVGLLGPNGAGKTTCFYMIVELVAAENASTPLTDSRIAELLGEQGIIVARRTVAKYREALQIPPVNLRKAP